jgi:hypothetical protein
MKEFYNVDVWQMLHENDDQIIINYRCIHELECSLPIAAVQK